MYRYAIGATAATPTTAAALIENFSSWATSAIKDLANFAAQRMVEAAANPKALQALLQVQTVFLPALGKNLSRGVEDAKKDINTLPSGIQNFRSGLQSIQGIVSGVDTTSESKVLGLLKQIDEIYQTSYAELKKVGKTVAKEVKEGAKEVAAGAGEVVGSFWDSGAGKLVTGLGVLAGLAIVGKLVLDR